MVPHASTHRGTLNGRALGPVTIAASWGTASQASALDMVILMESAVLPGRLSSVSAPSSVSEAWGFPSTARMSAWSPYAHRHTVVMSAPVSPPACRPVASAPSAPRSGSASRPAAWTPAARADWAFSTHQRISPVSATAPTRSAARYSASAGSSQPEVMSHPKVDPMRPRSSGLNTSTGPNRARYPAVAQNWSGRVSWIRAAPGWSMTRSPSIPVLPDRGGARYRV